MIRMDQTTWINILNGAVKLLTQHNRSHLTCRNCGLGFVVLHNNSGYNIKVQQKWLFI